MKHKRGNQIIKLILVFLFIIYISIDSKGIYAKDYKKCNDVYDEISGDSLCYDEVLDSLQLDIGNVTRFEVRNGLIDLSGMDTVEKMVSFSGAGGITYTNDYFGGQNKGYYFTNSDGDLLLGVGKMGDELHLSANKSGANKVTLWMGNGDDDGWRYYGLSDTMSLVKNDNPILSFSDGLIDMSEMVNDPIVLAGGNIGSDEDAIVWGRSADNGNGAWDLRINGVSVANLEDNMAKFIGDKVIFFDDGSSTELSLSGKRQGRNGRIIFYDDRMLSDPVGFANLAYTDDNFRSFSFRMADNGGEKELLSISEGGGAKGPRINFNTLPTENANIVFHDSVNGMAMLGYEGDYYRYFWNVPDNAGRSINVLTFDKNLFEISGFIKTKPRDKQENPCNEEREGSILFHKIKKSDGSVEVGFYGCDGFDWRKLDEIN